MCDEHSILLLSEDMARNAVAIDNLFNDTPANRGSKRAGCGGGAAKQVRKRNLLALQNFKCADCDHVFEEIDGKFPTATRDHVIPYRFGSTLAYNSEFVCHDCNQHRNKYFSLDIVLRFFGSLTEVDQCGRPI